MSDLRAAGCIAFATGDKQTLLMQIAKFVDEKKPAF
jgi:hypothetical protein